MLTFLVQDKEDKIKEYLQSDPENLSLVGKISFQIQLPRPLVAVFTDGSEKRQDLERVKPKAARQACAKQRNFLQERAV